MLKRLLLNKTALFVFSFCLLASPALAVKALPAGETVWQGEVIVDEPLRVPRDGKLVVVAGSTIKVTSPAAVIDVAGVIQMKGKKERPITIISPKGWQGVSFIEAGKGSSFASIRVTSAETAISSIATDFSVTDSTFTDCGTAIKLLRESSPLIENSHFENNDIAIDNEMRSNPTIRNNTFNAHRKTAILASHNSRGLISGNRFEGNVQAIGLLQTYPDKIQDNVFVGNKLALYCNQTKSTPLISRNRFERNEMALVNYSFAYPAVEDNTFVGNEMAIRNDQYGSPLLKNNLFSDNKTALYNYRKSNPKVENNLFEKNGLAMFCDYSSYPMVRNNHFIANKMAVELGIYQSADWEKRSGSKKLMQKEALARKSKNQMLGQAPTVFNDIVDVSGNWWGEATPVLNKIGKGKNIPFFHDRRDQEWVTYEGFGPESYRIDQIAYHPWLNKPAANVGPRSKK